ncbi:MAG: NADH dehydrogenase (quinone) subunit G [Candidatus Tectomicrobia bacterium RIFCSPLOWO2_12_FULL_69_37]|nr:MAG: NADH dehydrogenase (quinone) subunit G [Candidatus Tectomicrobia bacterium RIFCSPLOWO2_12_FULL_69_37]
MADQEITFTLNGEAVAAKKGEPVLEAALRRGLHIPHFCYHSYLSVVGQCRACLVDVLDAGNGKPVPKLQPACATPAIQGMVISTVSPRVKEAQEGVFEFLLKNHPLDCPVCDQGGECPLQDQTMAYAKAVSRTHELRRIYPRKELSAYVKPEMNRCVHCTRCIRFTHEIDGGGEFGWASRGDRTEVGIFEDLPLTSIVSGNVIDICPVGALTDNKYRFTARVWEMAHAEGPCTLCSVGCRQRVWRAGDELKRVTAGENPAVNDAWICDVGRYGWSGVHAGERILRPLIRREGRLQPASWPEALGHIARRLGAILRESGGGAVAGLGGAWATNESAFQFGAFFREVLGSNSVDCRVHPRDLAQTEAQLAAFGAVGGQGSIAGLGRAKGILLVGSDPFEEHPILALQVRKAARGGAAVVSVHPRRIDLRLHSGLRHLCPLPGEEARALRALAKALAEAGAAPSGEGAEGYAHALASADLDALCREADIDPREAREAARALRPEGAEVVVLAGPGAQAEAAAEAANLALLLRAELLFASTGPNLQGALDMGLHPALLPGGRPLGDAAAREACQGAWGGPVGAAPGLSSAQVWDALNERRVRALYLFGCDPAAEHPEGARVRRALEAAEFVVLHASHANASLDYAEVVLPAPTLYEEEGSVTNLERRVQRLRRAVKPLGEAREPWRAFAELSRAMEAPMRAHALDRVRLQARLLCADYAGPLSRLPEEGVRLARERRGAFRAAALPPAAPPAGGLRLILAPALWLSGSFAASAVHLKDMPRAALRLSPPDADRIGAGEGDEAEVELGGRSLRLPVRVDASLPVGLAQAPEGYLAALRGGLDAGAARGGAAVKVRAAAAAPRVKVGG